MCKDSIFIETMGYIKKQVKLTTVESNIIPNTFVLESLHPFPGYHGQNLPDKSCPRSLFFIVEKEYTWEEIARIENKIKQEFKYDFNISHGNIYLKKATYSCIRIKYLSSFTFVPELQNLLKDYHVKFLKKREVNESGLIVIHKHFYVQEMEEGFYSDLDEEVKYYFELPVALSWDVFKDFTFFVKNNIINNNFDVAQGIFFRKKGIVDVIRIYDYEAGLDRFKMIRNKYLDEIRKKL